MAPNCSSTDWICFLVLDIGNQVVYGLPPAAVGVFIEPSNHILLRPRPHQRAFCGLLQSFAVRAAGFSIVALSETAPALQGEAILSALMAAR